MYHFLLLPFVDFGGKNWSSPTPSLLSLSPGTNCSTWRCCTRFCSTICGTFEEQKASLENGGSKKNNFLLCKKYLYVTHIYVLYTYIYFFFTAFYFFVSSPSSSSKPSAATLQKKTVEPSQRQLPRDVDNLFHNLFNRLLHDLRHLN